MPAFFTAQLAERLAKICGRDVREAADSSPITGGEILLVSQFTLFASTRKGNRPSYIRAARPEIAIPLYEQFLRQLTAELGRPVLTGEFGADMKVELLNDGPVTILIDSKVKE